MKIASFVPWLIIKNSDWDRDSLFFFCLVLLQVNGLMEIEMGIMEKPFPTAASEKYTKLFPSNYSNFFSLFTSLSPIYIYHRYLLKVCVCVCV
mmetsp:Transcript_26109/g.41079  ORF Transcript_26109/g.41079 Transcript_26109/m.41079 type:complete len:93 (+) Transcript_26109:812-1090(+)